MGENEMERKHGDAFGFEIVTKGSFKDEGYIISTIVIRLSCTAMDEWLNSVILNDHLCYDTKMEWEAYKARKEADRSAWERKILDILKFPATEGYSITQSVSEIFTAVLFEKEQREKG